MGVSPRGRGRGGFRGRGAARGGFFSSPRGGGMARGRGRGRGFSSLSPGSNKLDRRPTSVLVTGYTQEEREELIKHFTKFGEIADTAEDEVGGSRIHFSITSFQTSIQNEQFHSRTVSLGEYVYHLQVQDPAGSGGSHDTGEDVPGEVPAAQLVNIHCPPSSRHRAALTSSNVAGTRSCCRARRRRRRAWRRGRSWSRRPRRMTATLRPRRTTCHRACRCGAQSVGISN